MLHQGDEGDDLEYLILWRISLSGRAVAPLTTTSIRVRDGEIKSAVLLVLVLILVVLIEQLILTIS